MTRTGIVCFIGTVIFAVALFLEYRSLGRGEVKVPDETLRDKLASLCE